MPKIKIFQYSFSPLEEQDFQILFEWQQQPHVAWWWQTGTDWPNFVEKYKQHIESDYIFPFIINLDNKPIGYIQYYYIDQLQPEGWHKNFANLEMVVGIDVFIGEQDYMAKGHGTASMKSFIKTLFEKPEIETVIVDPRPENIHAVHCFEKLGFKTIAQIEAPDGPVLIMGLNKSSINF